jgi:hypothetical protein
MKRYGTIAAVLTLSLSAFAADASCKGCGAGKLMLQCDYYVARQGDLSKRHFCGEYARIVDVDGASAKAAWYYLLGGEPQKALDAALRAFDQGQTFAAGYVAQALAVLGRGDEAKNYMERFREVVEERDYFDKEVETLQRVYPNADFSSLKE